MNFYAVKRKYIRLKTRQTDLEKLPVTERDHEAIAWCVSRRLALLEREGVRDTWWAHRRFGEMHGFGGEQ